MDGQPISKSKRSMSIKSRAAPYDLIRETNGTTNCPPLESRHDRAEKLWRKKMAEGQSEFEPTVRRTQKKQSAELALMTGLFAYNVSKSSFKTFDERSRNGEIKTNLAAMVEPVVDGEMPSQSPRQRIEQLWKERMAKVQCVQSNLK